MKILVLSCNTGEGHNAAGRAMVEWARLLGHEAEMVDIMGLAGPRVSKIVGGTYVEMVRCTPRVFHALYCVGGKLSSAQRRSPVYYANQLVAGPLLRYLEKHPADVIVCPHLFPAETLTYIKEKELASLPVLAISTDYTCIPFWEETRCDGYVIPHPALVEEYAARGVAREKLYPLGIPVRPEFAHREERSRARVLCGLPQDGNALLVMGGSMGFGKIHLFVRELLRRRTPGDSVVIVCGSNQRLKKTLERLFSREERVFILGFTREIPLYMDACDVIFTKPGGLTSTEAAAKGIPMVHTAPIPGCETANLQFFGQRGMSRPARTIEEQLEAGRELLEKPRREAMIRAQQANVDPRSAVKILELAEKMVQERRG